MISSDGPNTKTDEEISCNFNHKEDVVKNITSIPRYYFGSQSAQIIHSPDIRIHKIVPKLNINSPFVHFNINCTPVKKITDYLSRYRTPRQLIKTRANSRERAQSSMGKRRFREQPERQTESRISPIRIFTASATHRRVIKSETHEDKKYIERKSVNILEFLSNIRGCM